jgi:hypothetical protein
VGAAEKLLAAVPTHPGAREYLRAMYAAMGNTAGLASLDAPRHAPAQRAVPAPVAPQAPVAVQRAAAPAATRCAYCGFEMGAGVRTCPSCGASD